VNERGQYGQARAAGEPVPEPRYAAMRRAVRAIFNLYNHVRAPFYVYTEVNGVVDAVPAQSVEEANAHFAAFDHTPGEVYAAVFAVADTSWPDPAYQTYRAAPPERVAVAGARSERTRGSYGTSRIGAQLQHVLELEQRYEGVAAAAAQALLNGLATDGVVSSTGTNRWEVALKDGNNAWVRLEWDPGTGVLQVMITDKQPHPIDQVRWIRNNLEKILREKIAPRVSRFGAVAVGLTLYHSVGDRADAVKQMDIDWNALFASLAAQVGDVASPMAGVTTSAAQKARDEELAAWKVVDSFGPLYNEVERIGKLLVADGMDKNLIMRWREESVPPYADITSYAGGNEALKKQFLAAKAALDTFMPKAQRYAANTRAQELTARRGEVVLASFDPKKVEWWKTYALPLIKQWVTFKQAQLGGIYTHGDAYIAFAERFQTNWDVYEDWKSKLDALRAEAVRRGFTIDVSPTTPLPTTIWADAAHTVEKGAGAIAGGIGDIWTVAKYGIWAVLGIGAVVALSSVASNLRSGKDPAEKYMALVKSRSRTAARAALPAPAQLALMEGGA
jgi:hypothetical protein